MQVRIEIVRDVEDDVEYVFDCIVIMLCTFRRSCHVRLCSYMNVYTIQKHINRS